jgi:hypothetical protein
MLTQLNEEGLRTHVPIVGWVLILSGALGLVIAGFMFMLLAGIGLASGEPEARSILGVVGFAIATLIGALSLPDIAAGVGLLWRKTWGRVLAIVVSILNLINVPIGTLVGGYALWVLFQEEATAYFEGPSSD